MRPRIAIVLPPSETFSADGGGAISLIAHSLALGGRDDFDPAVIGRGTSVAPFSDVAFRPVRIGAWPLVSKTDRYAASVACLLAEDPPALIEVHNRPDIALRLQERFAGVPTALFLHNDPTEMRQSRSAAERRRLLGTLRAIVTVSAFLRARLLDGIPDAERAVVLPNPISCVSFPKGLPAAAREHVILFVGRIVADKGADAFVEAVAAALALLPGWRAEMFGADRFGRESPITPYLARLSRRARAVGIVLHGYRRHDEILHAMARAAIVVVPSRWAEPFGLVALEAMAAGSAVIASPRGALPEVIGDAAWYADPEAPGELASRIVALARDGAARQTLGEKARLRATAFDLPRIARRLAGIRREALGLS